MIPIRDYMFKDEFSGRYFMSTSYKVGLKLKKLYNENRIATLNDVYKALGLEDIGEPGDQLINPMDYDLKTKFDEETNRPVVVLGFGGGDTNDFDEMYEEFDSRYNPYPIQISRAEAFGKALENEAIDKETYLEARRYFGNLWFYVGD